MVKKGDTKRDAKTFTRRIAPRAFKAVLLAVVSYLPIYFLSDLANPVQPYFPWYEPLTNVFTVVFIFFLVAGVFLSGTIFQYVFGGARTLVLMIYFILILNGGIVTLALPIEGTTLNILVDLTVVLALIVLICLLGIARNVTQAIDFSAHRIEPNENM
jgi:hypothetical protein